MWPSRLPPIFMCCSWARPCVIATRFSLRVSAQRSARPVFLAAQAMVIVSRSIPILAPNPPPTSGTTTRIWSGAMPRAPARMNRLICAFCELAQTVSLPFSYEAAVARPSIGRQATRWLTMSCSTTTSHASNGVSSVDTGFCTAMLVPAAGNSRVWSATAAVGPRTTGSGS